MSTGEVTFGNLRDLGGLVGRDGRRVRSDTLLRSEALSTLDPESVARLAAVPVKLVIDLRSLGENEAAPQIWAEGSEPELVHMELVPRVDVEGDHLLLPMMEDTTGEKTKTYMRWFYTSVLDTLAAGPLAEFERRVVGGQTPVVVHCTAGQDRTGVMIAVTLLALGVPRDVVMADYMVTLKHFGQDRITGWFEERYPPEQIHWEAIGPFLVDEEWLDLSIDTVLSKWGSIEEYWAAAGVPDLGPLREALLEP